MKPYAVEPSVGKLKKLNPLVTGIFPHLSGQDSPTIVAIMTIVFYCVRCIVTPQESSCPPERGGKSSLSFFFF